MSNEDLVPVVNKLLHADGSVTTMMGEALLPADPSRAREFQSRAANADKWLHRDGSITDGAGRVILEADESRARDYAGRMALAVVMNGGSAPVFNITDGPVHLTLHSQLDTGEMVEDPMIREGSHLLARAAGAEVRREGQDG